MTLNAPSEPFSGNMDVDAFMAFLETRPHGEHWELIEGVAVMMAPANPVHQRVAYNLCNLLESAFVERGLDLLPISMSASETLALRIFSRSPMLWSCPASPAMNLILSGTGLPPKSCHRQIRAAKSI